MNVQLTNIWTQAQRLIKEEVSELSYITFIDPLIPVSGGSNFLNLEAPAEFIKASLEQKYYPLIKNALTQVCKRDYNINFILPEESVFKDKENADGEFYKNSHLNEKYTFDTFVVGKSNRMAHAAAVAIADNLYNNAYNPFFLYGGSGLGKTHLMHAIGNYVLKYNKEATVLYVTSEEFTIEYISAFRKNEFSEFRRKFRNVDLLMIDDIQFLGEKNSTVEEFFYTFNALYQSNKQIIIASDKPPKDLTFFDERLRSRFQCGLVSDIQKPDYETKIAILKKKAEDEGYIIPNEVYEYISKNLGTNIRELEGALNQILIYSKMSGLDLSVETAYEALKHITENNKTDKLTSKTIIEIVSRYFNVRKEDILSDKRSRDISIPRQISMYLCRNIVNLSFPEIGKEFGGKHHTTVMTACSNIEEKIKNDTFFNSSVQDIVDLIKV